MYTIDRRSRGFAGDSATSKPSLYQTMATLPLLVSCKHDGVGPLCIFVGPGRHF